MPWPPTCMLAEQYRFFLQGHIHVFETSKLRPGIWLFKKSKTSPEKIHVQSKLETGKANKKNKKINKKNHFKTSRFFKMHFLDAGGPTPPPFAECLANNASFLGDVLPKGGNRILAGYWIDRILAGLISGRPLSPMANFKENIHSSNCCMKHGYKIKYSLRR